MNIAWRPRSVRMRLTLWYGAALGAALLAYALFVYIFLWRMLSAELDHQLAQDIQLSEQALDLKDGRLVWEEGDKIEHAEAVRGEDRKPPRIEVVSRTGQLMYRSPSYQGITEAAFRILKTSVEIEEVPVVIRVARPLAPLRRELGFLALVLGLGIPLAVALATAGGYSLARRALAPVALMAAQANQINAEHLAARLPVENPDDELGRLAATFNAMFARLERSFDQLRRFTADASHEMRTPLAVIRGVGEVGLEDRRGESQYRETIGSMLEEADRLARLVDSLLTLSRADGGQIRLVREEADLARLAGEVAQQLGVLAEEKGQTLLVDADEALPVSVDRTLLSQALINLVDNAIKYSPEGAEIRIAVARRTGQAELAVSDPGPGIAPEHRERIFERFYRVDKARSRELGGTGLGLALACAAVAAHGGTIELESEAGRGSTFRIQIPLTMIAPSAQS